LAKERLSSEGVSQADMVIERFAEMMYQGQWRSLIISVSTEVEKISDLVDNFHAEHLREYNFKRDDAPVSMFRVAIKAT
mgnify:CR=1